MPTAISSTPLNRSRFNVPGVYLILLPRCPPADRSAPSQPSFATPTPHPLCSPPTPQSARQKSQGIWLSLSICHDNSSDLVGNRGAAHLSHHLLHRTIEFCVNDAAQVIEKC